MPSSGVAPAATEKDSEAEPAASEDLANVAADDLSLNDALRKKWANGVMSSKDHRVCSAGYHAELKRRRHQKCEDEKAKTEARAFGQQCRDLWLTMIKK